MTEKEMIRVTYEAVQEVKRAIFGNGRDGLIERVKALEVIKGKIDAKWLVMAAIALLAIFKDKLSGWL